MLKKFTTVLGLALMSSPLAFAAQAQTNPSTTVAQKSVSAQTTAGGSPSKPVTASKSTKRHKRHHRKPATPNATSKTAAPTTSTPKQ